MQTVNNLLRWSFYTSTVVTLCALTIVFATWFGIQLLEMLVSTSS